MRNKKGFTLAELMVVVAIIGVLVAVSVPIFNSQLEKSREATDLANVRSAYAQVMTEAMSKDGLPEPVAVFLNQTQEGWQTNFPITIGGVTFDGTHYSDNWIGTPDAKGMCRVSYAKDRGVIFNWRGGYAGDASAAIRNCLRYEILKSTNNDDTVNAFFSGQDLTIGAKKVNVRIYYADATPFKEALKKWKVQPSTYKNSPFYKIQGKGKDPGTTDGFAYYTYSDDKKKIASIIYVSPTNVYESKDEGRTWYDITHASTETTTP